MDFETGRRELDEMSDAEQLAYEAPTTIPGKIFDWRESSFRYTCLNLLTLCFHTVF